MDEDGPVEGGRTRLARGTKPNAPMGQGELAVGADSADTAQRACTAENAPVQAAVALRAGGDALVRSAIVPGAARSGPLPAGVGTTGGPVPADVDARGSGPVLAGGAPGSGPVLAGGAPGSAGRTPAGSIHEAVEQLIEAQEADEAIAEWMQGGG